MNANPGARRAAALFAALCLAAGTSRAPAQERVSVQSITEARLDLTSSNVDQPGGFPAPFDGVDVNALVGADRFYNAGYNGSRAILANIEAGHIDKNHELLTHATTQVTGTGALGTIDQHATWVGHALGGRDPGTYGPNTFTRGIADGATLWSGAIATGFGPGTSFFDTDASVASTYVAILKNGVGPNRETADVFNSSWGFTDPTGFNTQTMGVDGLINRTGVVGVASAGNSGPGGNTVGGIGAGYNTITVAALGADTDAPPYETVSNFSSRGPNNFVLATTPTTGIVIPGVRARVDIAAPGQDLTLAARGTVNAYNSGLAGTSFAAPIVAGGAALVVDAGKALYAGNDAAIDGRVVKAVLLNGAEKTPGWDNGQQLVGNTVVTTQSLDYAVGAGRLDLDTTFDNYVAIAAGGDAGTTDVAGLGHGDLGDVATVGWDYGDVVSLGNNTYFIDQVLAGGSSLTATLAWYADRNSGADADFAGASEEHLANLDLLIFTFDNLTDRTITGIVAESLSLYNTVEHLSFLLPQTGYYGIEVLHSGDWWNFTNQSSETYGLAWRSVAVPEPSSLALIALAVPIGLAARRRLRKRA
jgi:hypothetical protein